MGRNVKEAKVPVNGATFRNAASNGIIIEADGSMFLASNSSACLSALDFPKYVGLNTQVTSIAGASVSPSASKSLGVLNQNNINPDLNQYIPYLDYPQSNGYGVLKNDRRATRFHGMVANIGNYYVMQQGKIGYYTADAGNPIIVYDKANRKVIRQLGVSGMGVWYDSTAGKLKALAGSQYGVPSLWQSSDGLNWTNAIVTYTSANSNVFSNQWAGGSSSGLNCCMAVNGQNIYVMLMASSSTSQYSIWRSIDGGASFTDVTHVATPSTLGYFPFRNFMSTDGTTLVIDEGTTFRYSTNNGASWTSSSISGVTSSYGHIRESIKGTNASHLMLISSTISSSNYVWYSSNGGQSFTTYSWTPADGLNTSYTQLFGDQYNGVWAFAYLGQNQGTYVASSANNGATWTHTLVTANNNYYQSFLVNGGDALYLFAKNEIYKSTNGTTWTLLATNPRGPSYQFASGNYTQPYLFTDNYIVTGSGLVVHKTTGAVTQGTSTIFYSGYSPYKAFVNLAGSDHWIGIQTSNTAYTNSVNESEAGTLSLYAPYGYTSQQNGAGTQPVDIEYWRIK